MFFILCILYLVGGIGYANATITTVHILQFDKQRVFLLADTHLSVRSTPSEYACEQEQLHILVSGIRDYCVRGHRSVSLYVENIFPYYKKWFGYSLDASLLASLEDRLRQENIQTATIHNSEVRHIASIALAFFNVHKSPGDWHIVASEKISKIPTVADLFHELHSLHTTIACSPYARFFDKELQSIEIKIQNFKKTCASLGFVPELDLLTAAQQLYRQQPAVFKNLETLWIPLADITNMLFELQLAIAIFAEKRCDIIIVAGSLHVQNLFKMFAPYARKVASISTGTDALLPADTLAKVLQVGV